MTKQPVEFREETYYPIKAEGCASCDFSFTNIGTCLEFRAALIGIAATNKCWEGNQPVIWQSGDEARLKYITLRLIT